MKRRHLAIIVSALALLALVTTASLTEPAQWRSWSIVATNFVHARWCAWSTVIGDCLTVRRFRGNLGELRERINTVRTDLTAGKLSNREVADAVSKLKLDLGINRALVAHIPASALPEDVRESDRAAKAEFSDLHRATLGARLRARMEQLAEEKEKQSQ